MGKLPNAPVKRILLANGVSRISASALTEACNAAESYLAILAKAAQDFATDEGRKTVMDEDIGKAREACKPAIQSVMSPSAVPETDDFTPEA